MCLIAYIVAAKNAEDFTASVQLDEQSLIEVLHNV